MRTKILFFLIFNIFFILSCNKAKERDKINFEKNELLNKANEYYKRDEFVNALFLYNKFVEKDSSSGNAFFNKAFCEKMLFDYESSTQNFEKAIELNYRLVDAYYNIGCNYAATMNDSTALFYFIEAYKLDSNDKHIKERIDLLQNNPVK